MWASFFSFNQQWMTIVIFFYLIGLFFQNVIGMCFHWKLKEFSEVNHYSNVSNLSFQISITECLRIRHKIKKKLFLRKWYRIVGPLLLGLTLCTLFYETAKSCVGSLRPHFFAVCRPSIDLKNCTSKYTYITDYNCTAPENDLLIDSR